MITEAQYNEMRRRVFKPKEFLKPSGMKILEAVEREADLHNSIAQYCREKGWLAFHGSMVQRSHRSIGEPDFTIFADQGRVFIVEAKSRKGKLRPEQLGVKILLETLGHGERYGVVRSMNEFLNLITNK